MSIAMNKVILVGRLTRDPEEKIAGSGIAISRFALAVDRQQRDDDKTDFFNVTAFGNTADFVNKYLGKGRLVLVEGRVNIDKVEKNGETKYYTNVVASRVMGLETKRQVQEAQIEVVEFEEAADGTELRGEVSGPDDIPF